jgi:hypothetical protein
VRTDFLGLTGHQLLGVSYPTKDLTARPPSFAGVFATRSVLQDEQGFEACYKFHHYDLDETGPPMWSSGSSFCGSFPRPRERALEIQDFLLCEKTGN